MNILFFDWVIGIGGMLLLFNSLIVITKDLAGKIVFRVIPSIFGILQLIYIMKQLNLI